MKKLEAIIVPGMLDAVRAELERLGMHATLTLADVQQAAEQYASILPDTQTPRLLTDRLKVELIAGDRQAFKNRRFRQCGLRLTATSGTPGSTWRSR
jgi:nitrogen regulatory protein PII